MVLKRLEYFVAVVDAGSISAAARTLHLSQPPLSAQIRLLEEEMGCPLLQRGTRSVRVTPAGRILYERAIALLGQCEATMRAVQDYRNGEAGTLHVGVISSVANGDFADWAASFQQTFSACHMRITEANTYRLIDAVRQRGVELAIIRTPYTAPELKAIPLTWQDTYAVTTQPFDGAQNADSVTVPMLCTQPLIVYRRWEPIVTEAFAALGCSAKIRFVCDDARTCAALAARGAGCALVPASALSAHDTSVSLHRYRVNSTMLRSRVDILFDAHVYCSTLAQRFIDHVCTQAKQPPAAQPADGPV